MVDGAVTEATTTGIGEQARPTNSIPIRRIVVDIPDDIHLGARLEDIATVEAPAEEQYLDFSNLPKE